MLQYVQLGVTRWGESVWDHDKMRFILRTMFGSVFIERRCCFFLMTGRRGGWTLQSVLD